MADGAHLHRDALTLQVFELLDLEVAVGRKNHGDPRLVEGFGKEHLLLAFFRDRKARRCEVDGVRENRRENPVELVHRDFGFLAHLGAKRLDKIDFEAFELARLRIHEFKRGEGPFARDADLIGRGDAARHKGGGKEGEAFRFESEFQHGVFLPGVCLSSVSSFTLRSFDLFEGLRFALS